jgi:sulfur transfer protein SufE
MEIRRRRFGALIPFFGLVLVAGSYSAPIFPQAAAPPAKLTYSRLFKGSTPEYLQLTVDSKGSGTFEGHKLDEAQSSRPFQLSTATTQRIFALARQLDNFQSLHLESHKKVANLGQKTFTYQQGEDVNRVVFNYTENRIARELVDIFEALGAVEEHIVALEFEMKYDPLGLTQELSQIQTELNNKSLADPEILLPTLEKIARSSRFLHLAQVRAQQIIERIQPGP